LPRGLCGCKYCRIRALYGHAQGCIQTDTGGVFSWVRVTTTGLYTSPGRCRATSSQPGRKWANRRSSHSTSERFPSRGGGRERSRATVLAGAPWYLGMRGGLPPSERNALYTQQRSFERRRGRRLSCRQRVVWATFVRHVALVLFKRLKRIQGFALGI
jgi:hypothetical protein